MHTIRTALESFFYVAMTSKTARSIAKQISLLKSRGMLFKDEAAAPHFLQNIGSCPLKSYWWDRSADDLHIFKHIVHIYYGTTTAYVPQG